MSVCPGCGRCHTCGRPVGLPNPWYPYVPPPVYPYGQPRPFPQPYFTTVGGLNNQSGGLSSALRTL